VSTPARAVLAAIAALTVVAGVRPAHALEAAEAAPAISWTPRLLIQSDGVVARHGADAPDIEDGATHPGLYLRRARVGADAATGVWRARLVFEAAAGSEVAAPAVTPTAPPTTTVALDPIAGLMDGGAPRATEAFVALAPHKAFVLSAGALRVPIGLSRRVGEADLRLPERARIVARATPDFRAGIAAGGDLGLLQYDVGAYSAAPRLGADFGGGGSLYVLRLGGEPVGPLGVAPQLRRSDDPWSGWWRFAVGLSTFYAALPGANEFGVGGTPSSSGGACW